MAILAIDAGTTGITGLVLDGDERILGRAYREFTQHYPRPGWVEHDADEIFRVADAVARAAIADAGIAPKEVAAMGITNQRETTVVWDDHGPIHPAIVWQDRRTAAACQALAEHADDVRARTGLVLDAYFSATKVAWILDHVEGARARAEKGELRFGTIESWLAWKWTGRHVTDATNASRTLLYDIHRSTWSDDLLALFDVPDAMLPELVPNSGHIGEADLGAPVPIAGIVGDQQAALFGQRCLRAGQGKNTYGTGCFLLQHTGTDAVRSDHGLLTTRAVSLDTPQYALEGSVFVGGAAVQWLRDGLHVINAAPESDELAEQVESSDGVVVVPAFAGLGAPYWDPEARGAVLGITRGTDRRHLARATLESIAFQSMELVQAMESDSGVRMPDLRVDGGATHSRPLMQFQADLLQRPVIRPDNVETTALGSAYLAGIAAGVWDAKDLTEPAAGTRFEPTLAPDEVEARMATWRHAVDVVRGYRPDRL